MTVGNFIAAATIVVVVLLVERANCRCTYDSYCEFHYGILYECCSNGDCRVNCYSSSYCSYDYECGSNDVCCSGTCETSCVDDAVGAIVGFTFLGIGLCVFIIVVVVIIVCCKKHKEGVVHSTAPLQPTVIAVESPPAYSAHVVRTTNIAVIS
ncbi:uncharacterized protein LOC142344103 isoform X2 [Convolutriloba macropyga]|uniref:uncharacterized protein LOC142344103 isoform X1 n=1 Tax=Convolutriloba macropyga TaxID=536237 RepID=UPI003F526102